MSARLSTFARYAGAAAIVLFWASPGLRAAEEAEGCVDTWPEDRKAPEIRETFPLKGVAGHAAMLEITVSHLPGERVFPAGFEFSSDSSNDAGLSEAGFARPDAKSSVRPSIERKGDESKGDPMTTLVRLPLIPLPKDPGRVELTLPRLPVSISRASGQVHTICTDPHVITVEDPLASIPQPERKPDPEPRPQIEVWETLRDAVLALLVAIPVALLLVWLFFFLSKRWKKQPKPIPPRPPWEVALSALDALEGRRLLEKDEYEEYLDVVSDTLRKYLGDRYGFDGLESTTRETLRKLARLAPDFDGEKSVRAILQRADLVKFARSLPDGQECRDAMDGTRRIIHETTRFVHTPDPSPEGRPS